MIVTAEVPGEHEEARCGRGVGSGGSGGRDDQREAREGWQRVSMNGLDSAHRQSPRSETHLAA